ncbi:MAG: glycosyltransferase family 4 protein [Phycisphaerae bacterium]
MKICMLGDAGSVHIQRLAPGLAERGHEVHIVCHKPVDVPGASVERFRVPPPSLRNPRRWHGRWRHYLRGLLDRFDIVNIQFLWDWGFTPEIMQRGCVVASAWGSDIVPPPGEGLPSPDATASCISLLRHADAVTALGPTFAGIVAKFAGIDVDRVDVAPLGVDLVLFRPSEIVKRRETGPHRVGFFKGFREVYGPTYLIRAIPIVLRDLPDTRFDLIGDGAQLSRCKSLAAEMGVDHSIQWIPRQSHHRIPSWLSRWDLTVIPSVCEAFGVAALESSAMRVPVVASNVGGLPDTVRDGETGLLVPARSPEALAEAIVALLNNTSRRRRMGEMGLEWVRTHYEWQHTLDQWEHAFRRALDRAAVMV